MIIMVIIIIITGAKYLYFCIKTCRHSKLPTPCGVNLDSLHFFKHYFLSVHVNICGGVKLMSVTAVLLALCCCGAEWRAPVKRLAARYCLPQCNF